MTMQSVTLTVEWMMAIAAVLVALLAIIISLVIANSKKRHRIDSLERDNLNQEQQLTSSMQSQHHLQQQNTQYAQQMLDVQARLDESNRQQAELNVKLAEERTRAEQVKAFHQLQLKQHQQASEDLKKEFENLANRIFTQKSEQFSRSNQTQLASTLAPFKDQLNDFKRRIDDVHHKDSQQRQSLLHEIGHLKSLNQQISQDALNLTNALKADTKVQGNWGEVILERVLENSGLRKGSEYETQASFKDEAGKRLRPDVIVHLPDDKDIVIDAKVSLINYERYCSAEDEAAKAAELKAHLSSLRNHVNGIAPKSYESLSGINTLDFILVFVPIEPAFLLAFEHDGKLFSDAYEKGIIIVSPTTLLAVMRTVQTLWRHERQNKNADEIARLAGGLHDTIIRTVEAAEDVGKHLDNAHKAQQTMLSRLSSGRGNLLRSATRLSELGAKAKKQIAKTSQFNEIDEE